MSFSKALRREVMNYVATHNPSAYIPYHNNAHLEGVLKISTDLYSSECKVQSVKGLCTLTLAAMFHDFDHSGGTRADSVNIDYAIAGLQEFYHQRSRYLARLRNRHPRLHSGILAAAKNAIACTVYPFTVEPKTLVEKCLRDADILYACLSGDPRVVAEDLRSEMEISQGNPISNAQLLAQQKQFAKNARLYTATGRQWWDEHTPRYIAKLEVFLNTSLTDHE
ncbi:hypothetical protein ACLPJK_26570 [Pseudomonas aeruginosa]|uniref:hypothetical protein n=1 Tax=Pseudomonas aeruginosa TaxID=287 RepID=UPI003D2A5A8D